MREDGVMETYTTANFVKATGGAEFTGWAPGTRLWSGTFTSSGATLEEHRGSSNLADLRKTETAGASAQVSGRMSAAIVEEPT